jgi:uncharacterized protein
MWRSFDRLRSGSATKVMRSSLTVRDHAQTLELAQAAWGDVTVVGGPSSSRLAHKAVGIVHRARKLSSFVRAARPDIALSHGSYAQVLAARVAHVPAVTMMDYEFEPGEPPELPTRPLRCRP